MRQVQEAHPEAANRPFAVIHADTQGEPELVQAETVRLLTVNRVVGLLAGPRAGTTDRLLRAEQPYGAAVVIPTEWSGTPANWGVRVLGAVAAARGRALGQYASRDLKARTAIVLTDTRDSIAAAVAAAFRKVFPNDEKMGAQEWSYASAADTASLTARAARARPDLVLLACAASDLASLKAGLANDGFRGALMYGGPDVGPTGVGLEGGPDTYLATVFCAEKLTPRGQTFAQRYEAQFHEAPDLYAAQAYDGACLLLETLERVGNPTLQSVREELARTESFETVTGPIRWKGQEPRRAFFLMRVHAGKGPVVQTVEPDADGS
jgi:branched-chain amino acid transport system substrate-binding protein